MIVHSLILSIAARYIGPLLLLISLIVLYRGHNLPGGGFIGGLIAASTVLLYALANGWDKLPLPARPTVLILIGLTLAMVSGLPAVVTGDTFMAARWGATWELPLLGKLKLGTPLLFDVGVYFAVVGFTLKCAFALGTAR